MTRILLASDWHLSEKPPSAATPSYLDDLFDIGYHTVRVAKELDVDAVVWAGDIYHSKAPKATSHATIMRTIDLVHAYHCPLYIVPGNHDLSGDRFDSIFEGQPLGVVLKAGAKLLDGWADDLPIYGVPWQQTWDQRSVQAALARWGASAEHPPETLSSCLVVTHAPLYPPGHELPYQYYPTRVMRADVDDRAPWSMIQAVGSCFYGHVHESHGIYEVGGMTFCNHGAISRGSLAEHNLTREICATLWDSDTGEFTRVPLPHKPASEVFKLAEKRQERQVQMNLDAFLASINQTSIEITSIEAVIAHVKTLGLGTDMVTVIEELLQHAGS